VHACFVVADCLVRKADNDTKRKFVIEVLNPKGPLLYPPRVDYVYLTASNDKGTPQSHDAQFRAGIVGGVLNGRCVGRRVDMQRWYYALLSVGCRQMSAADGHSIPRDDYESGNNKVRRYSPPSRWTISQRTKR
jgi:hypothetical protein